MNEDMELLDNMRRLAAAQPREAGPQVEQKLVAAFRARYSRKTPRWVYAAVAAALLLGLLLLRPAAPSSDIVYAAPGFVALPYSQSGVPLESVVVIRVQMRPAELSSMGVAVPAAASTAYFTADLLVGQDGVARAVRLVK
jgi:hypothetical protein